MDKQEQFKILGILIGIMPLGFLIYQSQSVNLQEYQQYRNGILALQQQEALLSQNILKSRYELLTSYDELVNNIVIQKQVQQKLRNIPNFVNRGQKQEIERILDERETLLEQKESLSEWFKSQNSLLKNSLRYLPFLASQITTEGDNQYPWSKELKIVFNDLLRKVLLYNITTTQNTAGSASPLANLIEQDLQILIQLQEQYEISSEEFPIQLAVAHVNNIKIQKPEVEKLTTQLLLPLNQQTDILNQSFNDAYEQATQSADIYRFLTYIWSFIILLYFNYLLFDKLYRRKLKTVDEKAFVKKYKKQLEGLDFKQQIDKIADTARQLIRLTFETNSILEISTRSYELGSLAQELQAIISNEEQFDPSAQESREQILDVQEAEIKEEKTAESSEELGSKIIELDTPETSQGISKPEEPVEILTARLVFLTEAGIPLTEKSILKQSEIIFKDILNQWNCHLREFQGEVNSIKLLLIYPKDLQLSSLMAHLITASTSSLLQTFPDLKGYRKDREKFWHRVYFIANRGDKTIDYGVLE